MKKLLVVAGVLLAVAIAQAGLIEVKRDKGQIDVSSGSSDRRYAIRSHSHNRCVE